LNKYTEVDRSLENFIQEILEFSDNFLENIHAKDEVEDFSLEDLTKLFFASLILLEIKYAFKIQILTKNPKISEIVIKYYSDKIINASSFEKELNSNLVIKQQTHTKNKSLNFLNELLISAIKDPNSNCTNTNNITINNINTNTNKNPDNNTNTNNDNNYNNTNDDINKDLIKNPNYQKAQINKFDKEDDLQVNFIFASANIRTAIFHLKSESRFKIKDIAGNIIPAIASTNAIIAAIQASEALKLLLNCNKSNKTDFLPLLKNPSFNKSKEIKSESAVNYPKNLQCASCAVETFSTNFEVNLSKFTLGDLVNKLCGNTLKIKKPIVICGKSLLFNWDDDEEDAKEKEEIKSNNHFNSSNLGNTYVVNKSDDDRDDNLNRNFNKNRKDFDKVLSEFGVQDNAVLKIEEIDFAVDDEENQQGEAEYESKCGENVLRLLINFNTKLERDFSIGDLSYYFNNKEVIRKRKLLLRKFEIKEDQRKDEVKVIDLNEEENNNFNNNLEEIDNGKILKEQHQEFENFNNNNKCKRSKDDNEEIEVSRLLGNKRYRQQEN